MFTKGQKGWKAYELQAIIRQHKLLKKGLSRIVCTYVIACMEGKEDQVLGAVHNME